MISVSYLSCEDTGPINNVPKCIGSLIEEQSPSCGEDYKIDVDEYHFQNKIVYVFEYADCCCDAQSPVLDSSCDTIGFLHGFVGNTEINGEDFYDNATFLRRVWP
jgi:uncharacterized protein DUF6970